MSMYYIAVVIFMWLLRKTLILNCYLASSTRSSARKTRTSQDETTSPPAKGRRIDSSPGGDLEPLPSSPQSGGVSQERSLFSSPPQSRLGGNPATLLC